RAPAGPQACAAGAVLPAAGHAAGVGLAAELALRPDLAGHPRHLRGEGAELIDHRVDGVLELENLAPHVHRDLPRQVAGGDGLGDVGDVADLAGEVAGHEVDAVGEVLPGARHVADDGPSAHPA